MESRSEHLHPVDMPGLADWAQTLDRISTQRLRFCENFPEIARRFEAWWVQEVIDRPIFVATADGDPARPITRRLELLGDPQAWFDAKFKDMRQLHYVGDAVPHIRADFGPVFLGALLGATLEFGSDTGWTSAFINDDWSNAPDWTLDEENDWWKRLVELWAMIVEDAGGRYLACTPDLGGSGDVLLNLRGSLELCTDVAMVPEKVREAVDAIYPAWHRAFSELYAAASAGRVGLVHWLGVWSNEPYMVPACDFNALIGPDEFNALFLPDVARQAATVGRAAFHLDGPGAARHIDVLLEVPAIQVIQFTPGAGTPSALAWVDMFRKVQDAGRSLYIICPAAEALELSQALRPEGLGLWVPDAGSPDDLDALFAEFRRLYGM